MRPTLRKVTLAVHLFAAVGWIGAAVAYLPLAIVAGAGADPATIRACWVAMEIIGWWVLMPMSLGTLLTGVPLALGTPWGLLRHYWVVFSLVATVVATLVLALHLPDVSDAAARARAADDQGLLALGGDTVHAAVGLALLVGILTLNVFKPRGLTRYGWRRQQQQRLSGTLRGRR